MSRPGIEPVTSRSTELPGPVAVPCFRISDIDLYINYRFAISVAYYGLIWLMTGLAGNKYLNFFIGGAVETVSYALVLPVTKL